MNTKETISFIINPNSGLGRHRVVERMVDKYLDKNIYEARLYYISKDMPIERTARLSAEDGAHIVVAVGGDGSVNGVVSGIKGTNAKLGIIPVGSGNGLANFLEIPLQIKGAIEVINKRKSMLIDTLDVHGQTVVSIAGVGYDALVAEKMKKAKVRGLPAYMHFMVREYFWYNPKNYTLEINGELIKTQALFIAFANSNQFGYKRPIIPSARIDDGLMDICVVRKPPMHLISWVGFSLFFHAVHLHTKYIQIYNAQEVIVKQRKSRIMNIDGEAVKMPRTFTIKVIPKSIEVLIP